METLDLTDDLLMASGDNRRCYYHPDDESKCIKVLHSHVAEKVNLREKAYYEVLQKRGISWDRLARYFGAESTNYGQGLVFELIRDHDGAISRTLDYYLKLDDKNLNEQIIGQIEELKRYFWKHAIVFRDLITLNVLVRKNTDNDYHLIVIDGIGHNDALPICNFSYSYARKKIKRIWNRKKSKWFDHYPQLKGQVFDYE